MVALVGYTGFVGSNIYASAKDYIDKVYNSQNIEMAYGAKPDLLIYAGLRAEKYLANTNPEADMELVRMAEENITKIAPKKVVLISTIDVFKEPNRKDETASVETEQLHAYGLNRYCLERWVRENYKDALIIRLPGLFGINIKKNFIYDYINVIPFMLKRDKFEQLVSIESELKLYYDIQENGFFKCRILNSEETNILKEMFRKLGFTALNFTDSRNVYQYYPLSRLWDDIQVALDNNLKLWHPATEPVSACEVYSYLTGEEFVNEIMEKPVYYDFRTSYGKLFGGDDRYLMSKNQVLLEIKRFVDSKIV